VTTGAPRGPVALGLIALASGLVAFVLMALALLAGPTVPLLLLAGGAVALVLLSDARSAVLVSVSAVLLVEGPDWALSQTGRLYEHTPVFFTPAELLLLLALASVLIDAVRREEPIRLPVAFAGPFLLAAAAATFGYLNGRLSGEAAGYAVRSFLETMLPLFIVPVLIVNVVRTRRDLTVALALAVALAIAKAFTGLLALGAGITQTLYQGGPHMTYYEATGNFIVMLALLAIVAARFAGVRLPRWVTWAWPVLLGCLLLSYRRMFWVAALGALALVAMAASGRVGRRLAVPAVLALAALAWVFSQAHVAGQLSGPIAERATSITPGKISRNTQDRYRIAERHNVIADLEKHPVAGLGVGVGWQATYPLPFEYPEGRRYVHFAVLWWWLNMGLLGAITYGWLVLTATYRGLQVWRRHPDGVARVAGLALGIGILGLAAVELTSTVVGPDQRGGVAVGTAIGLLAAAHAQLRRPGAGDSDATLAR
jgi:hypothetical protein